MYGIWAINIGQDITEGFKENNLNNNKIEDILNGEILTKFYDKITNGDIPEHCRKKCSTKVKGSRVKEIYVNGELIHDRL